MRILWLSHLVPWPPKGGVLQRSNLLLRAAAENHDVDLIAFNQRALMEPLFENLDAGLSAAEEALEQLCASLEILPAPTDRSRFGRHFCALMALVAGEAYTMRWLRSRDYAKCVRDAVRARRPDLVLVDTISLGEYVDDLPGDVPWILDHHNIESAMLQRRADQSSGAAMRWYMQLEAQRLLTAELYWCRRASMNVTCSDLDSERLREIVPDADCRAVPNAVDTAYFFPRPEIAPGRRIIFVGTLSWYPNRQAVDFLADHVWPALRARDPEVEFDLIGAGAPERIEAMAARDPRFSVHGFVDDIRDYLAGAGLFVCPITDGGGTKLKILDAMAMGMAIVAHPIACEGIEVVDGESVRLCETPGDYVDAILELLDDPETRAAMGVAARRLAEEVYSLEQVGARFTRVLEDAVDAG